MAERRGCKKIFMYLFSDVKEMQARKPVTNVTGYLPGRVGMEKDG